MCGEAALALAATASALPTGHPSGRARSLPSGATGADRTPQGWTEGMGSWAQWEWAKDGDRQSGSFQATFVPRRGRVSTHTPGRTVTRTYRTTLDSHRRRHEARSHTVVPLPYHCRTTTPAVPYPASVRPGVRDPLRDG
jgi:hypothetical protein